MFRKCFTCGRKFTWCHTGIYRDSCQENIELNKVIFEEFGESGICDKVQTKDILDNMDVHNFAVHLFRQVRNWPNYSLHSVMFVIFSRFT